MNRHLVMLMLAMIVGCASRPSRTHDQTLAVCSRDVLDVVARFETTPMDTMMTLAITGAVLPASTRDSLLRTCGTVVAAAYPDSTTTIVSVGSRSIPCIAQQRWILGIEERASPPPLPR